MGQGLGLPCCGGCQCLRSKEGAFSLDPHVRFDGNAFGIHVGVSRQTDPALWKGYAGDTPGPGKSTSINLRIPTSGRPRLLVLMNEPNALTAADFDALGSRQGCLFECQANAWVLLESNDFNYLGEFVDASQAAVDGIASVPLLSPVAPDAVWCNPSYIPDSIQVTFDHWQNQNMGAPGELRRANFNGVPMSLQLTGTIVLGSRTIRNFGRLTGPIPPAWDVWYSDPAIICAGSPAWPKDTLRWQLRAQTNSPTTPDGSASQIWVLITEDQAGFADTHGCYTTFGADLIVPRYTAFWKYLSTFDVLDDPLMLTHWIKKGDSSVNNAIPDGVTYWTHTFNFSPSAPAIGDLLRCFP